MRAAAVSVRRLIATEFVWTEAELARSVANADNDVAYDAADLLAFHAAYRRGDFADARKGMCVLVIGGRVIGQFRTLRDCGKAALPGQTAASAVFTLRGLVEPEVEPEALEPEAEARPVHGASVGAARPRDSSPHAPRAAIASKSCCVVC